MNIIKISSLLVVPVIIAGTLSAAEIDLSKLPPPAKKEGITYAKDIQPILQANCVHCHGEERAKGKLHLDTLEGVLKGGEDGKVVLPGKSEQSKLIIAISQLDPKLIMPPKPHEGAHGRPGGPPPSGGPGGGHGGMGPMPKPLTPEQVGLFRAWVDQGAK